MSSIFSIWDDDNCVPTNADAMPTVDEEFSLFTEIVPFNEVGACASGCVDNDDDDVNVIVGDGDRTDVVFIWLAFDSIDDFAIGAA